MSTIKLMLALVLCDVFAHGLKAGQIVEADPALIKALQAAGSVDPHKEAIAAARARGAEVVRSAVELAAEQASAQRAQLQAEIAKAEAALQAATDDAVKAALQADLDKNRAALAALGAQA